MRPHVLVTLLKMRPHHNQSSRENATLSSGTNPLASYKKPPFVRLIKIIMIKNLPTLRGSLPKSGPLDFATKNTFPLVFVGEEALVGVY